MDNPVVWKSTGVAYSMDNGATWDEGAQILTTDTPRPEEPDFGGDGDLAVVWDPFDRRWLCYYTTPMGVHLAMSTDPKARPGGYSIICLFCF